MKKLFNSLFICLFCMTLVGCGEKEEKGEVGKIDLENENQVACTNIALNMLYKKEDSVIEAWKYVVDYEENNTDIKKWREIYTADFSTYTEELNDEMIKEIEEKIESGFCKGRVNDVTMGKYEDNKDLCKLTHKDKVFTAVVTYPETMVETAKNEGYVKEKLISDLESGEYDGGFRGIYTCDKNYDVSKLSTFPISGKQVTVEENVNWEIDDSAEYLSTQLERAAAHNNTTILEQYKVDIKDNYHAELVSHTNNLYVFDLKLDCKSNNESTCQEVYDTLYTKVLGYLLYPNGVTVK